MPQQLLDPIPLWLVFIGILVACLAAFEVGFWLGRRKDQTVEGADGGDEIGRALTGSMLALLAFLLAVTMGFAADRFDSRRGNVLEEANTIYTVYLQAGYLPEPYRTDIRGLLREYVPLRIVPEGGGDIAASVEESERIQNELWAQAELVATNLEQTDLIAMFVGSVNDLIEIAQVRLTAGVYARVPDSVILFLLILAVLGVGMVGYGAGLAGRRPIVISALMILALSTTLILVIDLDRPREGLLQVSQRPMIEVEAKINEGAP
jgi:hypothetical protein